MKKIGLIGGMSWESSLLYYKYLNERTKTLLGGFHSCNCIMESVDFAEIEILQAQDDWSRLNMKMASAAKNLENANADFVILCTNTMHLCEEAIRNSITVPFIHIAQATAEAINDKSIKKVLLLGTAFTMEKDFYKKTLKEDYGIDTIIPNDPDREFIHNTIYNELIQGKINDESRIKFIEIINKGIQQGAEGVILGCTEIPLLISQKDVSIPVFNTTEIHAEYALQLALSP